MLGKIEGKRRSEIVSITDSMDMNLRKLWEIVKGELGMLQSVGLQRIGHKLASQ